MKTSSKRKGSTVVQPVRQGLAQPVLAGAVLLIAVFAVYGPALNGPFLLDDTSLPYMQSGYATAPLMVWLKGMRPMLMLTYWMNFQSSGAETGSYHLINVILHILNGLLIFLSIRRLLSLAKFLALERDLFAGFAAGLFVLHPLQTESVSYIAS